MEFGMRFNRTARPAVIDGRCARQRCVPGRGNPVVLCVDDEPDLLTILRLFLSADGFEVMTALNATQALQLIEEQRPDIIITDHAMPGISGLELCRTLRKRAETREIPIILYSGRDLWDDNSGLFDRLVMKPAEFGTFARTVRSLLTSSPANGLKACNTSRGSRGNRT